MVIDCSIFNDKFEYLFNFDNIFEIYDDIEVLKWMGMVCGLELGSCFVEDFKMVRSLVFKVLELYVIEMVQGIVGGVFIMMVGFMFNGIRFFVSDLINGVDGMLVISFNGFQYSGFRVEILVFYVGEDDEEDDDFNENDEDD